MSKKYLKQQRIFSEELRRQAVTQIESNGVSVTQTAREYGVSRSTIYKWIYCYSRYNQKGAIVVVEKDSQQSQLEQLRERIRQLEQAVGQKQMQLDYWQKLVELASEDLGQDLKKSFGAQQPSGSASTGKQGDGL